LPAAVPVAASHSAPDAIAGEDGQYSTGPLGMTRRDLVAYVLGFVTALVSVVLLLFLTGVW
jgi:hypothetical protein